MKAQLPPEKHGRIAIFVTGDTAAELRPVFDRLKDGTNNSHLQELHEMPFGMYGQFYDRYGVQWIFRSVT